MSSSAVLYDEAGPRSRRRERLASVAVGALLVLVGILLLRKMASLGLFDDRWQVFVDPPKGQRAVDVWRSLGRGLLATLKAAAVAAPLAVLMATVLTTLRAAWPRWVGWLVTVLVEFLRGMPVLLMMFFGLLAFGLPALGAVVFGLTLYNAAVVSEILRAGIVALPKGQVEAGTAIGLTRWQSLRIIQFPQVVRMMLPSLISQLVVLLKDSSLGLIVGYPELLRTMQLNYSFFGDKYRFPLFVVVLLIYLVVNLSLSRLAVALERRTSARAA